MSPENQRKHPHNFLSIDDLHAEELQNWYLELARKGCRYESPEPIRTSTQAVFIFETPSSRTKIAFAAAANILQLRQVHLNIVESRLSTGEKIESLIQCMDLMGDWVFVVRTDKNLGAFSCESPVINAGDQNEHPSQGIVDYFAMLNLLGRSSIVSGPPFSIGAFLGKGALIRPLISIARIAKLIGNCEIYAMCEDADTYEALSSVASNLEVPNLYFEPPGIELAQRRRKFDFLYCLESYANGNLRNSDWLYESLMTSEAKHIIHPFPASQQIFKELIGSQAIKTQLTFQVPVKALILKRAFESK